MRPQTKGVWLVSKFRTQAEEVEESVRREMDVALEGEEAESARRARVKELEAMVLQLERENKKLLNKVTESADKFREEALSVAAERDSDRRGRVGSTDDLISLDGFSGETNEDEW